VRFSANLIQGLVNQGRIPRNWLGVRIMQAGDDDSRSDSWALKDLVDSLSKKDSDNDKVEESTVLTGYKAILANSLEQALEMIGRTGREVLYGLLEKRYELRREDIANKTGIYMSALRDVLGGSCDVIEKYMLSQIREETGVVANSLEEAVFKLKKKWGEV
jgi:hypothetical protein